MDNVTLEQLEEFDGWLTLIEEGKATQANLDEWLADQENGEFIAAAYADVFLGDG